MRPRVPCRCCDGIRGATPASEPCASGLHALAHRVGTHPQFVQSMHAALSRHPGLERLTTRAEDDPSMALIDAWAVVLDVLAFYEERILEEAFLPTATERRSILELARAIGYELRPGVAASTRLAFRVEDAPGAPSRVRIDRGLAVQSVPGQDELPQVFETVEAIEARAAWNDMRARDTEPAPPHVNATRLYLRGTSTRLKAGDALLIVGKEREDDPDSDAWDVRMVRTAIPHPPREPSIDPLAGHTEVLLDRKLGSWLPFNEPASVEPRVFALRARAAAFGHNAPDWALLPKSIKEEIVGLKSVPGNWPGYVLDAPGSGHPILPGHVTIDLDNSYPQVVVGGWLVLSVPDYSEVFEIVRVAELSRAQFGISSKVTRVTLSGEIATWERFEDRVRDVVVHAQSEELLIAEKPRTRPVADDLVEMKGVVEAPPTGRVLAITGNDARTGEPRAELATLAAVERDGASVSFKLAASLAHRYEPASVRVNANVAAATAGATRADVRIGSGNGAASWQAFELRNAPLTFVPSRSPMGGDTTLEVRVDGVAWQEVASFWRKGPDDPVFVTRRADDGKVTVQFGDGRTGARLPTGVENVRVTHRVGTGSPGNVLAGTLTTLASRPLGLRDAVNPLAAEGGQDPESLDRARVNAPLTVLTLDRIVSLSDHEDFAAAFLGVGKARADWLWNGERSIVHVTVAAAEGRAIGPGSRLCADLRGAMDRVRSPEQPVRVDPFAPLAFGLRATVHVEATRVSDLVERDVHRALDEAFGFERRAFAQGVAGSEVLAVVQAVPGVAFVDLDRLVVRMTGRPRVVAKGPDARLVARAARWEGDRVVAAELLTIDGAAVDLEMVKP